MAKTQQNTHQEGKPSHQRGRTNRRAKGGNETDERSIRQDGETPHRPGNMGGQGMGQGRGMNPGEAHAVVAPGGQPGQREEPKTQSPPNKPGQYDGNDQKGGDRSDRAAHSGATGERSTSGGRNKPEPKNQDEKGMGHPRNR